MTWAGITLGAIAGILGILRLIEYLTSVKVMGTLPPRK